MPQPIGQNSKYTGIWVKDNSRYNNKIDDILNCQITHGYCLNLENKIKEQNNKEYQLINIALQQNSFHIYPLNVQGHLQSKIPLNP